MIYGLCLLLVFFNPQTTNTLQVDTIQYLMESADSSALKADYDAALESLQQALVISEDTESVDQQLNVLIKIADLKYQLGEFNDAYKYYNEVVLLANANGKNKPNALALRGLAHILWRSGDNIKSVSMIIESIETFKALNDTSEYIKSSNVLAGIYLSTGKLNEAEEIYDNMLQTAIARNDSINMASNYGYKGVIAFFRGNYEQAIIFYNKALSINLRIGDQLEASILYGNIGEAYGKQGKHDKAIEFFNAALEIQEEYNFLSGQIFIYYSLGEVYMITGNYTKALDLYIKSIELMEISGESREKHYVYNLIADNYARQGKFEEAYQYHKLFASQKDSIFNTDKNLQLEVIRAKYDFEQQERDNFFLAQQNESKARELEQKQAVITRQYILGGLILILLFVSTYLSIKLYRNKKLLTVANDSKDKLFGFIAHDLKSPIGNIQSLSDLLSPQSDIKLSTTERANMWTHLQNASNTVMVLLNDMLSWSLTQQQGINFKPTLVSLSDVVLYNLELFNYQLIIKEINLKNSVPKGLNVFVDAEALSTIVRNLVSNAVKFTPQNGTIELSAMEDGKQVKFIVKDNGVGIEQEQIDILLTTNNYRSTSGTANEKGTGLGLNLIKDFVYQSGGSVEVESKPQRGTSFYIYLPSA